jgi:hypothetical protein
MNTAVVRMRCAASMLWAPSQLRPAALGLHLFAQLLHVAFVEHLEPLPVRDAGGERRSVGAGR